MPPCLRFPNGIAPSRFLIEKSTHTNKYGCYITRILGLVNLAPDVVEAVCNGREPEGVSLAHLVKGFPDDWGEQRMIMGLQSSWEGISKMTAYSSHGQSHRCSSGIYSLRGLFYSPWAMYS